LSLPSLRRGGVVISCMVHAGADASHHMGMQEPDSALLPSTRLHYSRTWSPIFTPFPTFVSRSFITNLDILRSTTSFDLQYCISRCNDALDVGMEMGPRQLEFRRVMKATNEDAKGWACLSERQVDRWKVYFRLVLRRQAHLAYYIWFFFPDICFGISEG
jgi:hypothetical protein